jgi:cation transport regulator ChaC
MHKAYHVLGASQYQWYALPMSPKRYVFGYGSIVNPASMAKDIDPKLFRKWTILNGYERIFDWPVDGALALNLRKNPEKSIDGILIEVDDESFEALERREKGYSPVDLSVLIDEKLDGNVFAFIAPNEAHPDMHIAKDYFDLCADAIPRSFKGAWLASTVIENPIN